MEMQSVFTFAKESGVFGQVHFPPNRVTLCTDGPAHRPVRGTELFNQEVREYFFERPDLSVLALFFRFAATTAGLSSYAILRGTPFTGHLLSIRRTLLA